MEGVFEVFDIPPLGYSIYTAKKANTSKCEIVKYIDRLRDIDMEGGRVSFGSH